ncbi:cytochrome c biogenesis CcdA family protein [Dongia sp.]|uniref:cytochrome c biogenesis CcdA family protein n=1 Tax=Dongia sp. TaxID=1977262 RepID=UPI003752A0D7
MALAFLAGLLSTLSPCVLPLLPVVFGAAVSEHKLAPLLLAAGIALSFTGIGLFVALAGFALGLDAGLIRIGAALLMMAVGVVLAVPPIHGRLVAAAGPVSNLASDRFGGFSVAGPQGQLGLGLLLGAVWSPCVGPTLGAASLMAAQGRDIAQVTGTMLLFGIGAAVPLLLVGLASRRLLNRWRDRIMLAQSSLRTLLGVALVLFGLLVLTGADRGIATAIENVAPDWLTDLTTRF